MAYSSGSLLGNYAPAMQEPYAIESNLAKEATGGSSALAATMMDQYWYERQLREGDYAQRLGDQMAFGQQQLRAQQADTVLKAMPELAKTNLLPATSNVLMGQMPSLDPTGLQYAAQQAAQTTAATNLGTAGRGAQGFGAAGYNLNIPQLSGITGVDISQGTPTSVQAQAEANKGRLGAAAIGAAARNAPTYSTVFAPADDASVTTIKGRGTPPGYGTSLAPASGGGRPAPNQATPPPPNYRRADDTTKQTAQAALEATKNVNPQAYRDAVDGYVGNKPNAFVDNNGHVIVMGKSGNAIPLGNPNAKRQ